MANSTSIVIFGASGDLTERKLIPALYNLYHKGRMPDRWQIIGVSRTEMSHQGFRDHLAAGTKEFAGEEFAPEEWAPFAENIYYCPADLKKVEDMRELDQALKGMEDGPANRMFYLAIGPRLYEPAVANLGEAGMVNEENGWRRVVVEKPFGHDLPSAQALNKWLHRVLNESQIYRIDHYLGKETVQNILVFRFANALFEPVWNRNYIDHVQITTAESIDVGHRAAYYDTVGVLRDMMQNHMLQLLSLVAIEPPISFNANALRDEKSKLLRAIRPIEAGEIGAATVRGQYEGYRQTEGVAANSEAATYGALRLYIDNWRWQGVPFYMRSGKALAEKVTEISIIFKEPPHLMFPLPPGAHIPPNRLSLCIQPDEGIHFCFQAKVPDTPVEMRTVDMSFHYDESFEGIDIPEAYERLLLDIIKGDASLFTRSDAIELAWALFDPIIACWESEQAPPLHFYEPGSWGPPAAGALLEENKDHWAVGCGRERRSNSGVK